MGHNDATSQPGHSESQHGSSVSQPGNSTNQTDDTARLQAKTPGQPCPHLSATLCQINTNMGSMADLLKQVVEGGGFNTDHTSSRSARKRRQSPPPSESSDSEDDTEPLERGKRPRCDDKFSLSPSDEDVEDLLGIKDSASKGADGAESTKGAANEDESYLKTLEVALENNDPVGGKIQLNLANIGLKRWGISLSNDKLKVLLDKHAKPENCADVTVAKVNPEIWSQMHNFKRKTNLRVGNVQQALEMATFAILKSCNTLLSTNASGNKETLSQNIDAIALSALPWANCPACVGNRSNLL